jgi:hypothetical protein
MQIVVLVHVHGCMHRQTKLPGLSSARQNPPGSTPAVNGSLLTLLLLRGAGPLALMLWIEEMMVM